MTECDQKMYQKQDLIPDFLHECQAYLDKLNELLSTSFKSLQASKEDVNSAVVNEMFRLVHTVKGTSGYMGFTPINQLSHAMESLLSKIRDGHLNLNLPILGALIKSADELDKLFLSLSRRELHLMSVQDVISILDQSTKIDSKAYKTSQHDLLSHTTHIKTIRLNRDRYAELSNVIVESAKEIEMLKVAVFSLDDKIIELKNSEGIKGTSLKPLLDSSNQLELLSELLKRRNNEISGFCLMARMQPLAGILKRFKNLVTELAERNDKLVQVKIRGGEIEADTLVCDAIAAIFVHIIRNMIDHGIEPRVQRFQAGKSEKALIKITAKADKDEIIFEFVDDGRGINADALVQKAIQKGLLKEADVEKMDYQEKVNLMFLPGITTAKEVTDISGRGVGMDAVMQTIQELGGSIRVYTQPNLGTKFSIRLPKMINLSAEQNNRQHTEQVVSL